MMPVTAIAYSQNLESPTLQAQRGTLYEWIACGIKAVSRVSVVVRGYALIGTEMCVGYDACIMFPTVRLLGGGGVVSEPKSSKFTRKGRNAGNANAPTVTVQP
jgi:hypothetical protein